MNCLRAASGILRLDRLRNVEVYKMSGMAEKARGVSYGVADWVKRST